MLHLSIVVPVYSGENFLRDLLSAVQDLRNSWVEKDAPIQLTELIFVDDNAIDNSAVIIDDIASEHDWVVALHLSRNFGQHPATIAGILHSSGDWVVTLDEDLQHPPSHIADMIRSSQFMKTAFGISARGLPSGL
jgi:glycosyltransferase involved in cell wall biosynthesis